MTAILTAMLAWNLLVFGLYGWDKWQARRGGRRIRESTLLSAAFLLGGVGALAGMRLLRHKTRHMKFILCIPSAAAVTLAGVYTLWRLGR